MSNVTSNAYTTPPSTSIRVLTPSGVSRRFYPISETKTSPHRRDFKYGFIITQCKAIYGFGQNNTTFIEASP